MGQCCSQNNVDKDYNKCTANAVTLILRKCAFARPTAPSKLSVKTNQLSLYCVTQCELRKYAGLIISTQFSVKVHQLTACSVTMKGCALARLITSTQVFSTTGLILILSLFLAVVSLSLSLFLFVIFECCLRIIIPPGGIA